MKYIKIILTVIAALLALNIFSRCFISPAGAQNGGEILKVDIVKVDGYSIYNHAVPVEIK